MLVEKYVSNLPLINDIVSIIDENYSDLFIAVIVHGSVATNEVIKFSDFDGLLIVKDEFLNSKRLKKFKKETFKRILAFDPIQHHGWFQISERDLKNYPEFYFPQEILKYSKVIYPRQEAVNLDIKINTKPDYVENLKKMLQSFEHRIKINWKPNNMYQLKSILSQIMLIPSLFYAAKNNEGIFKKYSFEALRPAFNDEEWLVIDKASQLRAQWDYKLNGFQRFVMLRPERIFRKITEKYVAPKITTDFKWDKSMYQSLELLILKINKLLDETH